MRRVDDRMTRKVGLALTAALLVTLALTTVGSAQPAVPPAPPEQFWGNVVTDKGKPLAAGAVITVKAATGPWTGTATTTVDASSRYGWETIFLVPENAADAPWPLPGNQLAFYVLGVQAKVHDASWPAGTWADTVPFTLGGHANVDLQVAISYTITASAGPNGAIAPSGAVKVDYGFDQTFTITPDPNYLILDVLVDGVSSPAAVASGSYTFTNVTADHTISASFVRATYLITPIAGVGCTITPATQQVVPYKGSQPFTIAANAGYVLADVKVDDVSKGPITAYTFTDVTADHTIAAICMRHFVFLPVIFGQGD